MPTMTDEHHELRRSETLMPDWLEQRGRRLLSKGQSSVSTLATGLGHDIGNIVLPILCHLDSLESRDLPDGAKTELRALRQATMRLKQLSSGLNLLAQDAEDSDATTASAHLYTWWLEVQPILKRALPQRVTLEVDIPEELPAVAVPPHQLTAAVLNLVVNAGEASEPNSVVKIWAKRAAKKDEIEVGVTDTGRGMSTYTRRHALDPFFTTKKRGLSTGLGLSQVADIMQAVNGSVSIQSTSKQGTTVVLRFHSSGEPRVSERRPAACVKLADVRMASHARALLMNAGFALLQCDEEIAGDASLLITDRQEAAADFVKAQPNRRAIVLGRTSHNKNPLIVTIDASHRSLKRALRSVARDLL